VIYAILVIHVLFRILSYCVDALHYVLVPVLQIPCIKAIFLFIILFIFFIFLIVFLLLLLYMDARLALVSLIYPHIDWFIFPPGNLIFLIIRHLTIIILMFACLNPMPIFIIFHIFIIFIIFFIHFFFPILLFLFSILYSLS
jgi:hypothetical protein